MWLCLFAELMSEVGDDKEATVDIKLAVWTYKLFHMTQQILRQVSYDKSVMTKEQFLRVLKFTKDICTGFEPPEKETFYSESLPNMCESLLIAAKAKLSDYLAIPKFSIDERSEALEVFKSTLAALLHIVNSHSHLIDCVLNSNWFTSLFLITDDHVEVVILEFFHQIISTDAHTINLLHESLLTPFLDEIVCKLTTSQLDPDLGSFATKSLLVLCQSKPAVLPLFDRKYKGLLPLLNRWEGKGFNRELYEIKDLIESYRKLRSGSDKKQTSAIRIQALWRSYITRRKLSAVNHAFAKFQTKYRERRRIQEVMAAQKQANESLQHRMIVQRKRRMRQTRQRRLDAIAALPSELVEDYLEEERVRAAVAIQSVYRGHLVRRKLSYLRSDVLKIQSVVVIQRMVRRFLNRRRQRRMEREKTLRIPYGLNDARRVELQEYIKQMSMEHNIQAKGEEERRFIHEKCQRMLHSYLLSARSNRVQLQKNSLLLSRLNTDMELVSKAPLPSSLPPGAAASTNNSKYLSCSKPSVYRAKEMHKEQLKLLSQAWYRKLSQTDDVWTMEASKPLLAKPTDGYLF